ncbi:MAG: adenylate/guanylate cyclase domain-containing protein [Bacteroidia bacterium]|nr:adenylate/guanylate cyclase domain-containing protein [Bacteroidia bacterium]
MPQSRRLAAIMFADIAGYTAMMQRNEKEGLAKVHRFSEVMEAKAASNNGEILEFRGDGCLAVFNSAVEAMHAAKAIQENLQKEPQVPLRIGIHIGDIVFTDGNIYGDGVNLASRVESMGVPGSILVTERVIHDVKSHPEFEMASLGKFQFKNVEKPMEVFALANEGFIVPKPDELAGKGTRLTENATQGKHRLIRGILSGFIGILIAGGIWMNIYWKGSEEVLPDTTKTPSIAVMPFLDLSPKQDQAFLGDGMAEEVINLLSKESELKVSSRSSSFSFKKQEVDLSTIANKLGVDHILEGSVKEYGGRVKISVQLIEAKLDKSIWAENWEEPLEDVFGIQEHIAREVMESLKLNLIEANKWNVEKTAPDAYRLFLQAKHQFDTESNASKARELVLRSLERDSSYAPAWILLGHIDRDFARRGNSPTGIRDFKKLHELAKTHALKGIKLGPNLGYAYASLANTYIQMLGKSDSALFYALKSIELAPGDANAISITGLAKCFNHEFEEGLALLDKAEELDPLSWISIANKAWGNNIAHRFDLAEDSFRKWLMLQPKAGYLNYALAICLVEQGKLEEAEVIARKEKFEGARKCALSIVAWEKRDIEAADTYLEELIEGSSSSLAYQIAQVYGYRKDVEKTFEWLERSFKQYDPGIIFAPFELAFSFMHKDPRWGPFVEKVSK